MRVADFKFEVSGFRLQVSDFFFVFQVSGFGAVSGFGFRVSRLRGSGSGFALRVTMFRVSAFGDPGFGFLVSGLRVEGHLSARLSFRDSENRHIARHNLPKHQIVFFNCLDLYHQSLDSGERQYISRTLRRQFEFNLRAGG